MRGPRRMISAMMSTIALAGGMVLAGAGSASAEPPQQLGQGYVIDESGVLSTADEEHLEQRLSELASTDGVPELYVILVPDFEDPGNALQWADATALRTGLGSDQYLLAIATDGRSLAISAEYGGGGAKSGPLSESRVLEIEDQLGADYLSHDDWAGGIAFVADEFSEVPWPWWAWVLIVAGVALLIFLITRLVLLLRRNAALRAELRTLEGQKKRASRQLVRTDEAVRTSEQELGFVTVEFGDETTAEYSVLLKSCRQRLQEAFELLQKLEDTEPDTPADTRAWTQRILDLCAGVDRDVDSRTKDLAALRSLTVDAPATLARLKAARADASGLQEEAANRLSALAAAVPATELVGIAGNPQEIGRRLRAADVQLGTLEEAVAAKHSRAVLKSVHEVERLLAEAVSMRDAVIAQADVVAARRPVSVGPTASGTTLEQARAAVHAAELSVQARPGTTGALALRRLALARRHLNSAIDATDPAEARSHASSALSAAQQVQSLIQTPVASGARFAAADPVPERPVMYDSPSNGSARRRWSSTAGGDDEDGPTVGKALWGAVTGGVAGTFIGFSMGGGEAGLVLPFALGGVVIGAISGAFGGSGGGSSSGWGGSSRSSRSSWSSSRSSSSRSSFSSRSSGGGSRSSGRSGGRHF